METYFLTNTSFRVVETDFLASTNHSFFSAWWKCIFFNESFISAIGEGFSLYWKPSTLLDSSFVLAKTITNMNGNHFLKTNFILASGNHFFPLPQIFFKKFFIPASGNTFSSPGERYCYLLRTFFPASGNII